MFGTRSEGHRTERWKARVCSHEAFSPGTGLMPWQGAQEMAIKHCKVAASKLEKASAQIEVEIEGISMSGEMGTQD